MQVRVLSLTSITKLPAILTKFLFEKVLSQTLNSVIAPKYIGIISTGMNIPAPIAVKTSSLFSKRIFFIRLFSIQATFNESVKTLVSKKIKNFPTSCHFCSKMIEFLNPAIFQTDLSPNIAPGI